MTLSFREIADILKAIDESSADEINIEVEGLHLSIRKRGTSAQSAAQLSAATAEDRDESVQSAPAAMTAAADTQTRETPQVPPGHEMLRSPMVGTFYSRPSPDEPPFVEVGSTVAQGDPVCLIEVMKLYTTVESNATGEIASVYAADGVLVEYDQPLYLIKT